MLARDFIGDRLYHPQGGYFCNPDVQVGQLKAPIDFKSLLGYEDYQKALVENYPKNAWLTPCEIFKPYYGMSIGNYIHQLYTYLQQTKKIKQKNIKIIEVGAGTGTAASNILFFLKNYESAYYQNIQYNILDISPQMCEETKNKLSLEHKRLINNGQIRIINEDFYKYNDFSKNDLYFIIFLEVFDNMPHDRVFYNEKEKKFDTCAAVELNLDFPNDNLQEVKLPINDRVIQQVLKLYQELPQMDEIQDKKLGGGIIQKVLQYYYKQDQKNVFLPTFSYKVLEHIHQNIPNHHLIVADFDLLRNSESALQGINAPIVSKKGAKSHEKQDYKDYLVKRGEADIFFPTDFRLLQSMYKEVTGKKSTIFKSKEFMQEFSKKEWTETKSGYNPLLEDFTNTSFFVTQQD
ncbi:hypothetical protein PPERSA_11387 [Pseudocohnilembus persalinus]|uniref:Protein arginine methyltransferase NDUFAF7 n=1 Tax=Pseudocohnilembus persalinus TaxID=266149 RepID=A0A0V0QQ75_PSEPJ|nr:hypothetical protein PPERSA_11387 [Pseudocohnilembus persalinus]|eukprot:KRX04263.1 hypothetical protein PPERSA_11387 [Pseudocohnilembus persalinus]